MIIKNQRRDQRPLAAVGRTIFSSIITAPVFAIFYGASNGILTIAHGTLPLAQFGPRGFGRRVGVLSIPARATGAVAPLAVGLLPNILVLARCGPRRWPRFLPSPLFFLRARRAP